MSQPQPTELGYDKKVKFPTFDYQGLPILYVLMWLFSAGVVVSEKFINAPVFFYMLFLVSNALIAEWWFRKKFIARNNGENWVVVGHQFSEKYIINQKRYNVSDLTFKRINRSTGENSSTGFVQLFFHQEKILDCPGSSIGVRDLIPELFDKNHNKSQQNVWQDSKSLETDSSSSEDEEKAGNFWSNIEV